MSFYAIPYKLRVHVCVYVCVLWKIYFIYILHLYFIIIIYILSKCYPGNYSWKKKKKVLKKKDLAWNGKNIYHYYIYRYIYPSLLNLYAYALLNKFHCAYNDKNIKKELNWLHIKCFW